MILLHFICDINMCQGSRKCFKCGNSPSRDPDLKLYRFPKPGKTNILRCELWAKYCFPNAEWSSQEFQKKLYLEHRMLCHRHFKESSFIDFKTKKLHRFAAPDETVGKICFGSNIGPLNFSQCDSDNLRTTPRDMEHGIKTYAILARCIPEVEINNTEHREHASKTYAVLDRNTISDDEISNTEETSIDVHNPHIIEDETRDEFQPVSGKRVVDMKYLFNQLQEKAQHNKLFDCKAGSFQLIGEKRVGLISVYKFECNICKEHCLIESEDTNTAEFHVNFAALSGIVSSGISYSQFKELFAAMNIPVFSAKFFKELQDKVYDICEKAATDSLHAAAAEEKE